MISPQNVSYELLWTLLGGDKLTKRTKMALSKKKMLPAIVAGILVLLGLTALLMKKEHVGSGSVSGGDTTHSEATQMVIEVDSGKIAIEFYPQDAELIVFYVVSEYIEPTYVDALYHSKKEP